jgi:ABC-type Fe3+/spermidine/putrescine transport system ATPase subunit
MSHLMLENLSKRYGEHFAVDGVSLSIAQGEFVSLLGPSGCGKTTTLQMIAGFVEPTSGSIRIDGRDLLAVPAAKRGLGIVFQNYALFPHLSVTDNVSFGLEMRQVAKPERARRVAETLDLVGLTGLSARYPAQLSGGQQQRVALARALVIQPELLLLDEPLSNLDAKLRAEMQVEMSRIQRTIGITTLMVTHDQAEALALSDRVVVMNAGHRTGRPTTRRVRESGDRICLRLSRQIESLPHRPDRWRNCADRAAHTAAACQYRATTAARCPHTRAARKNRLWPSRIRSLARDCQQPCIPGRSLAL